MTEELNENVQLINAVRSVGIIKPSFNPLIKGFDQPRLEVKGTGFWLSSGIFITCAHVVSELMNQPIEIVGMLVVGGNEKPYRKALFSSIDYTNDLAVLKVEPNDVVDEQNLLNEIRDGLEIYDQDINIGDNIAYAGFPLGNQLLNEKHSPSYAEGIVGNQFINKINESKLIQISGPVIGGFSGSPIVLRNNFKKVISIVSNSPSIEAGQANIFRGCHWKHIKAIENLSISR